MLPLFLLIVSSASVRALDCNFDRGGLCRGVSQNSNDKFDWRVRKGRTPSSGTGPSGDVSGTGYYAYIEASSPRRPGDNALLDFDSNLSSGSTCISFFYQMNGRHVGELRVLVNGNEEFSSKGSKGTKWIKKMMTIAGVAAKKVTFEGIRGPGWQGDIAIDEVSIKSCGGGGGGGGAGGSGGEGGCALDCNFDRGGLCRGVSQNSNDKFDWRVRKGRTPSSGTGPSEDVSGTGYYAYIEASSPRRPGDNALLDFDSNLSSGSTCISFFYQMNGRHVGELRVLVNGNEEFSSKGSKGTKWIKKMMTIAGVAAKKVTFEGIRGPGWQGDIAIDEVSIKSCGEGGGAGAGGCGTPPLPNTPPPPPTSRCGIRPSTRIVGGTAAKPGDWPWQGMLRTGSGFPFCGGTLVAPQWLVTAAHCIERQTIRSVFVRLGADRRIANVGTEQDFNVAKIIKHPSYHSPIRFSNDIALLKLDKPAILNREVNLACLPQNVDAPSDGTQCWITGWGRLSSGGASPDKLQQVSVPIASRARCDRAYPRRIDDSMICAGLDQGGIDSCQGDSGGPMVCETGGRYYLQGVTSWGDGCASPGKFGVYAKVKFFLTWINDEMRKN